MDVGLLLTMGEPRLGALAALRNVSCVARQGVATSLPFVADTFFWVDGRDCCFWRCPGRRLTRWSSARRSPPAPTAVWLRFECLRLNNGGVLISADPATNQVSSIFTFIDAQLENGAAAANMVTIENGARSFICDVTLVRPRLFDSTRTATSWRQRRAASERCASRGSTTTRRCCAPAPCGSTALSVEGMRPFPYSIPIVPFAASNAHYVRQYGSAIDARNVSAPRPSAILPIAPLAVEQNPVQWSRLASNGATVTPGVLAPMAPVGPGASAAPTVASLQSMAAIRASRRGLAGVRGLAADARAGCMPAAARLYLAGGGLNGTSASSIDIGRFYEPMAVADNAWKWVCEAVQVTHAGSGSAHLYLRRDAKHGETSYFMPGLLHFRPEHGFTDAEVGAVARSMVAWPSSATAATVALLDHQLLQFGGGSRHWSAPRPPADGEWRRGDVVWNTAPTPGGPVGWMCIRSGSPGDWSAMGRLDA